MPSRIIIAVFVLLSSLAMRLHAQQSRKADSMIAVVRTAHDTIKVQTLIRLMALYRLSDTALCTKYFLEASELGEQMGNHKTLGAIYQTRGVHLLYNYPGHTDEGIHWFHKGLQHYEAAGDWKNVGLTYKSLGIAYNFKKEPEKSFTWLDKAYDIFQKNSYRTGMGEIERARGHVYEAQGKLKQATDKYYTALKLYEETNNQAEIGTLRMVIGNILMRQQLYDEALKSYEKALVINLSTKDMINSAGAYISIGNVYYYKKRYEDAVMYYMESLKISEEINDNRTIAKLNTNIGNVRLIQGKEKEAEEHFEKAESMFDKLGDKDSKAVLYINIGDMYTEQKEYNKALSYFERSLSELKKIGNKERIKECYLVTSKAYAAKGDHRKALEYHQLFSDMKDSLYNTENSKVVQEMNTKYETEKKESEIALLKKESEKDRAVLLGAAGGIVLLLALTGVVTYSYRRNKRANRQLAHQNEVIQTKNKDITDSINYAKRIQEAMLPSAKRMKDLLPESFVFYKPKDIISGDFYWCTEKEGDLYIAAADCTGHGVPGALMSMIGINFLDHIVNRQNISDTSQILYHLHESVLNALNEDINLRQSKDGMDIALLRIKRREQTIQFSGAVRPLYFVQDNEMKIIKGDRYSIGGILDSGEGAFAAHNFSFTSPATFYMFSDGYIDQFGGPQGKKFMARTLQQLLLRIHLLPAEEQKSIINNEMNSWQGRLEQVDDMLVIGVKI